MAEHLCDHCQTVCDEEDLAEHPYADSLLCWFCLEALFGENKENEEKGENEENGDEQNNS